MADEFPPTKLEETFSRVLQKDCWHVSAGGAVGATFGLDLGEKLLRKIPLRPSSHSDEFRMYEGELRLTVWCTWRLDSPSKPVASSQQEPDDILAALQVLVGAKVSAMYAAPPAWDLTIEFSRGLSLKAFCDDIAPDSSLGCWDLGVGDVIVCAGPGYSLTAAKTNR